MNDKKKIHTYSSISNKYIHHCKFNLLIWFWRLQKPRNVSIYCLIETPPFFNWPWTLLMVVTDFIFFFVYLFPLSICNNVSQFERHFHRFKVVRAVSYGNQFWFGCWMNANNGFTFVCESVENGHSLILLTTLNSDAIDEHSFFFDWWFALLSSSTLFLCRVRFFLCVSNVNLCKCVNAVCLCTAHWFTSSWCIKNRGMQRNSKCIDRSAILCIWTKWKRISSASCNRI